MLQQELWLRRSCHPLELLCHLEESRRSLNGEGCSLSKGCGYYSMTGQIVVIVVIGGLSRYNYHLKEAGQIGVKKGLGSGMVLAFIFFTINSLYAVVFW